MANGKATLSSIAAQLDTMANQVKDIHAAIYGDNSESKPGLKIEVDRMKQLEKARRRHFAYVWAASGTLLVERALTIFGFIKH